MLIDCNTCTVRGNACKDCVVTYFVDRRENETLDEGQTAALELLADSGMVPRLRMAG